MQKRLLICGSTGSIGDSTLEIVRQYPDKFKIVGLCAGNNSEKLLNQALEFLPDYISISNSPSKEFIETIKSLSKNIELIIGPDSAKEVAKLIDYDLMVASIVGIAGLPSVYEAVSKGKVIALANKESLVCGGQILTNLAEKTGAKFYAVDSEHSAIWQCLLGNSSKDVNSIILTASGGPFLNFSIEQLKAVTREQALKHPKWVMGAKVTVDSSTLFNKALEVIEARWLFQKADPQAIEVIVHPQSIVHSMVRYHDGSVIMQASVPDMKQAIGFALSYPEGRLPDLVEHVDFNQLKSLEFLALDESKFPSVNLAKSALSSSNVTGTCVALNASNEVAVSALLQDKIHWNEIFPLVLKGVERFGSSRADSLDDILGLDSYIKTSLKNELKL